MTLRDVYDRFPDPQDCVWHLEWERWGWDKYCPRPRCLAPEVAPKKDGDRVGRWNCRVCRSSFNVLSGTVMEGTRLPLQVWFHAIGLILRSEDSLSTSELARELEVTRKTALRLAELIRAVRDNKRHDELLTRLLEKPLVFLFRIYGDPGWREEARE